MIVARIGYTTTPHVVHPSRPDHKTDTPGAIPSDVLAGLSRHVGYIKATHPERIPEYRQRLSTMIDELHRNGQDAKAQRLAALLALLVHADQVADR